MPHGKTLLSLTGRPYDTLRNAIADAPNSLVCQGMVYRELPSPFDMRIKDALLRMTIEKELEDKNVAAVFVQRSRGYAPRRSLSIGECEPLFAAIKKKRPDVAIVVDNCYGELVEDREPTHVGADLAIGSLIKNLGGSLAPAGAYVAGRGDLIERVADRLYAPGLKDVYKRQVDVTLKLPDPAAVTAFITSLSYRSSPNFQHFLRPGQFGQLFGPPLSEVAAVDVVLRSDGLRPGHVSSNRLSIPVTAPASVIDRAFHVSLLSYRSVSYTHLRS